MKISELLNDDDLYQLWTVMTDALWGALIENYSTNDITEAFHRRRAMAVHHTRRPIVRITPRPRILHVNPQLPKVGFDTQKPDKRSF